MYQKNSLIMLFLSTLVLAEGEKIEINEIAITANPLTLSEDEMARPVHIFNGIELNNKRSSSLGSTLESIPGVSNSSWGDNIGRPVIRGMDRNRIKLLNNGIEIRDVSNMSGDHAISFDSLASEQIEIIRGPETVIYGGGAVGGVVNIIDYRIHPEYIEGTLGRYDVSKGGASNKISSAISLDFGANNMMFHLDLYERDAKNLKIPGFSVSKKLADSDDEFARDKYGKDILQNSYNETNGGGLGATYFFDNGHTGFSFAQHEQEYGTILENGAYIDLESDNFKYEFEILYLSSLVNKFKFKLSHSDYEHKEIKDNAISQDFFDKGDDVKFELVHSLFSKSGGAIGLDLNAFRFQQKNGSFAPNNQRKNIALYTVERFELGEHNLTLGLRHDYHDYQANSFTSDDGAALEGGAETSTSFSETEKTFNTTSLSLGSSSKISANWTLGFTVAHAERAPSHDELFVYGEHHATEIIEQGSRSLKDERSNSIDLTLSWKSEGNRFSVTPYYKDFNSYIALLNTGTVQYHDHDGEKEALPVYLHQNIPAEFYGFEFQGNVDLSNNYGINYWGDYTRAKNKNGGDLPRIPPLTLGTGIYYHWNALNANLDLTHTFSQSDVASNELKTDDYNNLSLTVNYDLPLGINAFIKGDNLLDEEKRDHTSFLKDKTLMGERSFTLGITGFF